MEEAPRSSDQSNKYVIPRAHRLIRGLAWLYAILVLAVGLWVTIGYLPPVIRLFGRKWGFATGLYETSHDWVVGGLGAIALPALLVALTALVATLLLTGTRFRYAAAVAPEPAAAKQSGGETSLRWYRRIPALFGVAVAYCRSMTANPGTAARMGQAVIVTTGAVLVWTVEWLLWPRQTSQPMEFGANIGVAFALAFVSLVAERSVNAFPEPLLPEAPTLRRLLLFSTLVLVAAACLEIGHSAGIAWVHWLVWAVAFLPGLIMLELALRALARLFLPPPLPAAATAVTESVLAALLTGGPRSPGIILRTHLGLDFSRSWAVRFLSAALLPAAFGTGLLCWGLSGVKLIDLDQRGIYERFGAPVAVLGPGLHILLPWPLGRLRPVEYGGIHSVAIGVDQAEPAESMAAGAEAPAPLALNRLWESSHPGQAYYLVPSTGAGPQGFQSIATEIYVLYRVGLNDSAAMQSVYTVADPESLVRNGASRLVLRYFNSRTLEAVIGARRENVAGTLRDQLAAEVDSYHAGIEIVSVLIEEIHPPTGAAAAYHAVQAAEINAKTSIFDEQGKAKLTTGEAHQNAYQMITAANAKAAEVKRTADAEAYRFNADRGAYAVGGKAFLMEHFYSNLNEALSNKQITIQDHRIKSKEGQGPILDLRPGPAAAVPTVPKILEEFNDQQ